MILAGEADIMFAGGTDSLSRLTVNGFGSLLLIDPEGCRPFDADRKGTSLGEGAAVLALESAASAARRKAPVLAKLSGWANSRRPSRHSPRPRRRASALSAALHSAGLPRGHQYINAHGQYFDNDRAEAAAIRVVFMNRLRLFPRLRGLWPHFRGGRGHRGDSSHPRHAKPGGPQRGPEPARSDAVSEYSGFSKRRYFQGDEPVTGFRRE